MFCIKISSAIAASAVFGLAVPAVAQPASAALRAAPAVEAVASARKGWDGTVKGMQIVTPVEIGFSDAGSFDDFAAGRLPIRFVLRSTASGQTIRLEPRAVTDPFQRGSDKAKVTIYLAIGNLLAPVWDGQGCIATSTGVEPAEDGTGVMITLTYSSCTASPASRARTAAAGGDPPQPPFCGHPGELPCVVLGYGAAAELTSGLPIPGVGVVVKKNPGGGAARIVVATGPSRVSEGSSVQSSLPRTGASNFSVLDVNKKGTGSPKAAGF